MLEGQREDGTGSRRYKADQRDQDQGQARQDRLRVQMGLGGEATLATLYSQWHALVGGGGSAGRVEVCFTPARPVSGRRGRRRRRVPWWACSSAAGESEG